MGIYTQAKKSISISTPLGDDVLLLTAIAGSEHISELFEFDLETLSESHNLEANKLIGKAVTVNIHDKNGRFFNGYVNELQLGGIIKIGTAKGHRQYNFTIVPWLWFLSKRTNCRIFQKKTAVDIIKAIFNDHPLIAEYKINKLSETYVEREYCVQFNETDLDFVIRLMEEEGIAYYFEHSQSKHTLILVDQKNTYGKCKENKVEFASGSVDFAHINSWNHQYSFCEGKRTQRDYNFKKPKDKLEYSTPSIVDLPLIKDLEHYNYPGYYDSRDIGVRHTKSRMVGEELSSNTVEASSNCSSFIAGSTFELSQHEAESEQGKYIIVSIFHSFTEESYYSNELDFSVYSNHFTCIPESVHFRPLPLMIKPMMRGPQTAVVVGTQGEEIDVDEFGRIKVQFYWDREGKYNENSSCWIRVAQALAGNKWGSQVTPRIGQEVIVNFLDGDPDRPIITGSVYNKDNMPTYPSKTQHGIKSHSTLKGGASNFNELRFEDKKGSEELFIQAEKDFHRLVKNNEESDIKANHTMVVKKASKTKAQSVQIKADDFIEFVVGGSTIKITPTGILVKTTKADIKGSAMVVVKGGLVKLN